MKFTFNRLKKLTKANLIYSLFGFGLICMIVSCNDDPKSPGYEFMPDMYRGPSYKPNSDNPNFKDSMTNRKPVEGTVARNQSLPFAYPHTNEGYEAAGKELKSPLTINEETVTEGKRLYEIFCVHCHGAEGKGDGSIVQNGKFPPPPSYSNQLKSLPEGKMFWTITYGKNLMGSHASQLNQEDRWKIISYVQTLQKIGGDKVAADSTSLKKVIADKGK
jgi:mono/diheme cytochrome c family protein